MQITIRVANAGNGKAQKSYVGPLVRVGRNPDAEICFHDGSNEIVSWDHAIIELRPSGAFLQDQGSSNGTFLNDRQLERRTQLNVRDTIRLGTSGPRIIIEAIQSNPTPASEARELGDATPAPPVGAPATSRVDEPTRERRSLTDLRLWQMTGQRSELTVVIVGLLVLLACAVMAIALRNGQSPSTVHVETTSATAPAQPGPTAIAARSPIELDVSTVPRSEELSEIRDLLHEVLEERKTSKEPLKSRERLLKYALQQRTAEKEHAGGERDEAIRSIERIQLVNEARNYVLGSFNAANTGQVSEFTELSHRLKRLRHVQEQWTNKFVTLPEDSLGQV
ncbi:MAG TPA: FHA domain-containing protein, partial [Pirellulaceae bacterium]|nr:FHA domain-containing protein [Pirellulaceae bacterium]